MCDLKYWQELKIFLQNGPNLSLSFIICFKFCGNDDITITYFKITEIYAMDYQMPYNLNTVI